MQTECTLKIHFGMGVAVGLRAPVVSSTTLHGSELRIPPLTNHWSVIVEAIQAIDSNW